MASERVVAAMSGGVDSAVAAGLLVESGYDVVGITMKMYAPSRPAHAKSCCGSSDFDDARRSAASLGIPHYVLDFQEAFRRTVVDRFVEDYVAGRTPNPCVSCNNFVKLGTLAQYADRLGARFIATGHYARVERGDDGPHLFRSRHAKDQAYALAQLAPAQLNRLMLPLGDLDKATTRAHARRLGLPVHDKAESQDICFVEGGNYRDVVANLRPEVRAGGAVVASNGDPLGEHEGVVDYTIGQRARLPASSDGPRYVTQIDAASNTIVIGREDELLSYELIADEVNLIRPERFASDGAGVAVRAMIRYRATPAAAMASVSPEGLLRLRFEQPQRAVSPGQLVALIDATSDEVLGGATIGASSLQG
jgi:tRNA-uridine 2-sulfurtransferase